MSKRVVRRRPDAALDETPLLRRPVVVGAIVVTVLLAVALIAVASGAFRSDPATGIVVRQPQPGRALGPENAPVKIVEYSDFQCPFCARAATDLLPPIEAQYIANGTVRFEYQPVAFLGQESMLAAEAALCAEDQQQFWAMHDKLFASQAGEERGQFAIANLKRFAQEIGLDRAQFEPCLDSHKYQDKVLELTREAQARGVEGTPTFFVNNDVVPGAVPFEQMQSIIERNR